VTPTPILGVLLAFAALAVATIAGWILAAVAGLALGRIRGMQPAVCAALIAQARLMPLLLACILVPAQLIGFARFEAGGSETAGPLLIGLASVGLLFVVNAVVAALSSWRHTHTTVGAWRASASRVTLPGWTRDAWRIERRFPVVAVVGIVRPQLFVATKVAEQCSTEELAAIVAHETAHVRSGDNLMRLLFRLTPGVRVAGAVGDWLERAWMVAAEEAADAAARRHAAGLELASALTKVARLAAIHESEAMPASALIGSANLQTRVRRLLEPPCERRPPARVAWLPLALVLTAAASLQTTPALVRVHELFELLVRR
jgi:Zn-dependent protease with chaperone function